MTRDEAIQIIKERNHALDPKCVEDFCDFCGYTKTEFWSIDDGLYNGEIFEKDQMGRWKLENAIYDKE